MKQAVFHASRAKFHFIYVTTCLVNDRYYIGMHSTDDLDDGYIGSGKRLWYSINKHGLEQHKLEILEFLPSREQLKIREAEHINEERIKLDPYCMNLALGGGQCALLSQTPIARLSRKEGLKKFWSSEQAEATKNKISEASKTRWKNNQYKLKISTKISSSRQSRTEEEKEKYSLLSRRLWAKGTDLHSAQVKRVRESWKDPICREARSLGIRKAYEASDDIKKKQSAASKKNWLSDEYRSQVIKAHTGLNYKKQGKFNICEWCITSFYVCKSKQDQRFCCITCANKKRYAK